MDIKDSNNVQWVEKATLLAIHCAAREKHNDEPISRKEMAARAKILAKAGAEYIKIIMGWILNFRTLTIALPESKYVSWEVAILEILEAGNTSLKKLEQMIGRLVHLGIVLTSIHHFMSRLVELLRKSANRKRINLNTNVIEDLRLMLFFLEEAHIGVDVNLLVYRKPTKVYGADSCPAGVGRYSSDGFAWRFYIPSWLKFRASNNLLDRLATVTTPWINIIAKILGHGDCSLPITDSSTSEGCLRKSNFKEYRESPIQAIVSLEVSRSGAKIIMENKIKNYSPWFPSWMNDVSDALSWDDDRSDNELINMFRSFTPSRIPDHF